MAGFEVVKQVDDLLVCQLSVLGLVLCWLSQAPYINAGRGVSFCSVLVAILGEQENISSGKDKSEQLIHTASLVSFRCLAYSLPLRNHN